MRSPKSLLGLAALVLAACGGDAPPPQVAPAPPASASAASEGLLRPITQGQLAVAHYATADGRIGLVLDRTGDKAKLRIDGDADIVELTPEEDRFGGELRGTFLRAPDGKARVYLSAGGGVKLFHGNDELWVTSDKPADPLLAATITGTYVRPKPAYDAIVTALAAVSVSAKLPQYTAQDASNLAKVGEVIQLATADMFVHYQSRGATSWLPSLEPTPDNFSGLSYGGVAHQTDDAWDKTKPGLLKYGGELRGFSEYGSRGNHMQVMIMAGYPLPLAESTPGLVWSTDGPRAIFVSLDGGRYRMDLSGAADKGPTLALGAGPEAQWPAPLQHPLVDVHFVSSLVKAGVLPQQSIDDLTALDDEWNACAQKTWAGAQRAVDSQKLTEADRKDWAKKVEKACAKSVKKQEAALVTFIEGRNKDRQALFDKAKARVLAVGANK
jgi:hypothetical protein